MRLRFFAAASLDTAMSSRPPYRGGRNPYRRGLCDKVSGINQFVSGDTHFQSVRDANRGGGTIDIHSQPYNHRHPPQFDSRLSYSDFRPPQNSVRLHHPPRFHQNQSFRPPASYHNQPFRPQFQTPPLQNQQANTQFRNQKPLNYRNWEYAKILPPPECDRFSILSYNILADYLATDHRNKLYFHIPRHMMDWEWRKRNIFFELGLWSADILCFQEVDRFHDIEEELKLRGYCGTWKMRTGNPVDGCAIFWRFSRFKLLHEESIEFNKLGLRDNVAQICVLERINQKDKRYNSAVPTSTGGSSKIVVGNIHVLYNPRRGEIKLGQVRVLLDRAYAVSKLWDDAPVVLCGDFNSTPKSPLYNYISERELELSGLPRDTLSGQAAAEIRPPRSFSPNLRTHTVDSQAMINDRQGKDYNIPTNNYHHAPIMTDDSKVRQGETVSNTQKDNDLNINNENAPAGKDFSVFHCIDSVLPDSSELSNNGRHSDEEISDNGEAGVYDHLEDLHFHVENSSVDESHKMHPVLLSEDGMHRKPTVHSHDEDTCSNVMSTEQEGLKASDIQCGELHQSNFCDKNDYAPNGSTTHMLSLSVTDKTSILPTTLEVNIPVVSTSELSPQVRDPDVNNNYVDGVRTTYNPSAWTPMEVETATGSADSTRMESPLKLISTYSEVEDSSGTRDAYGEPEVTSYNRCFLGTVDYIWRSEGLQTVRVLAPIPKHAMQWTNGFPTKKWGSDHIALVSELAFTKDVDK